MYAVFNGIDSFSAFWLLHGQNRSVGWILLKGVVLFFFWRYVLAPEALTTRGCEPLGGGGGGGGGLYTQNARKINDDWVMMTNQSVSTCTNDNKSSNDACKRWLQLGCCSFLRALLISQGLEAGTYAIVRIGLEISLVSVLRAALVRSQDWQTQSEIEICQTQITLYTRGLKDSGHNQGIKLAVAIISNASIETRREVRKFSVETYKYN